MGGFTEIFHEGGFRLMKKSDWQYLVDTLLFICIVGITFIGFIMGLIIPKGPTAKESAKYFLGLHRHQWGNVHFYLSLAFVVLVIIHLILSWTWIKGKARQLFKRRWSTVLILTSVVSIVVLFLFWLLLPRIPGTYKNYGTQSGQKENQQRFREKGLSEHQEKIYLDKDQGYITVSGQMTLRDVEKATGIPARTIANELGLPTSVPLNETLGRLRKKYSFRMQEVREIVSALLK